MGQTNKYQQEDQIDIVELVCKSPISKGELIQEQSHENLLKLGVNQIHAAPFQEISKDLGYKLLAPISGRCFDYVLSLSLNALERGHLALQVLRGRQNRPVPCRSQWHLL